MMKKLLKSLKERKIYVFLVGMLVMGLNPAQAQEPCEEPTIAAEPVTICSGNLAVLTATSEGESVFWYDSESATTSIAEGTIFESPILTSTTSYWVEAVNYGEGETMVITNGGRVAPSGNSGSAVVAASSPWGLRFNAYEDFVLNSVDVFITAAAGGEIVVNLLDSGMNVMETTTVMLPPGGSSSSPLQHTITLNFNVPQGNDYRLVAPSSPAMIREFSSDHPGFPYPIGNAGAIVAGSINATGTGNPALYYFFYNWTVTLGSVEECVSERIEVLVNVDLTPDTPTGETAQNLPMGSLISDLEVAGDNLTWYADENLTQELTETTELTDVTTYYVIATDGDCQSEPLVITVTLFDPCEGVTIPAPEGEILQIVEEGSVLADLVVEGENLVWYADEDLTEQLPETTELIDGTTYYVIQTISGCMSEALGITVQIVMSTNHFDKNSIKVYPNPVSDILTVQTHEMISEVNLFNLVGQKIDISWQNNQIDMTSLAKGNYILIINIDGISRNIKITKQ